MRHDYTAAAQRALTEGAAWFSPDFVDTLEAPALLLGLLTESECRAAMVLASHGVDIAAVRRRWPGLTRQVDRFPAWGSAGLTDWPTVKAGTPVRRIAPEIEASLAEAARWLRRLGLPVELGTEHILFGLAALNHEVSSWLHQQGVRRDEIEAQILRLHGLDPALSSPELLSPIPLEEGSDSGGMRESPPAQPRPTPLQEGEAIYRTQSDASSAIPHPSSLIPHPSSLIPHPLSSVPPASPPLPQERLRVLRVMDAAANRAREGLRVVEDYARFALDDRFLTGLLKELRHELTSLLSRFSPGARIAARETQTDVGTSIAISSERRREDTASVLAANFTRLQESVRSLEEFAKILDPDAAAALEQLRYRSYTLHRAVETTRMSMDRLQHARLYVLIDGRATHAEFCDFARTLVSSGVPMIQLRDKQLDDRRLLERARALREITSERRAVFIMNDRPDLAALARADGVHVGQEELSVKDARTIVGPEALIGVSAHSIEQARQAVLDGASYIGVGPTFPSGTKHFEQFPGLELLRAVAAEIRLPAFAIGGVGLGNLPQVLETGLGRVAVSGAIAAVPDPGAAARAFLALLV